MKPCTEAQNVECCAQCEFKCESMCDIAKKKLEVNNMEIKTKKQVKSALEIKVTRAKQFDNACMFDMVVNGVTIYGCRVIEGKEGDFVSFPSHKGKDDKYYNHCYIKLSDEATKDIIHQVEELL